MKRLVFLSLMLFGLSVQAAVLDVVPLTQTIALGAPLNFTIRGNFNDPGLGDVTGGQINIKWDPTRFSFNLGSVNPLWDSGLTTLGDTSVPGEITGLTFLASPSLPVGIIEIATLELTNLDKVGSSLIELSQFGNFAGHLDNGFPTAIDVAFVPGAVTVGAIPIPAAVWLFGSAILGLGAASRRKRAQA